MLVAEENNAGIPNVRQINKRHFEMNGNLLFGFIIHRDEGGKCPTQTPNRSSILIFF